MLNTLCIERLPLWVTDHHLRTLCEQWGAVVHVRVAKDANSISLGYAFVEMASRQDAENVLTGLTHNGGFECPLYVARTYPIRYNESRGSIQPQQ
ncbi:RNA recognition motif domain-containing protein [Candidatus Nitrospira bockiana]